MASFSSPSSSMSLELHRASSSSSAARSPVISYPSSSCLFFPLQKSVDLSHRVLLGRFNNSSEVLEDESPDSGKSSFSAAVRLFNAGEYYRCHDVLEALWNDAEDPLRTLYHGILQCAVGFHHLFNQNHKGAMMELGEGLCKLRKMKFQGGPLLEFEQEIGAALEFIYQTQIEMAACAEDLCLAMDRTERSYQLLGGWTACVFSRV